MAYQNGQLPPSALTRVQDNMSLANTTARAWFNMKEAAAKDGINLTIAAKAGAYRDLSTQRDMKANPDDWNLSTESAVALAGPGYSTHGFGQAVDIAAWSTPKLNWMESKGRKYGFTRTFGPRDPNHYGHDNMSTGPTLSPADAVIVPIPRPPIPGLDPDMNKLHFFTLYSGVPGKYGIGVVTNRPVGVANEADLKLLQRLDDIIQDKSTYREFNVSELAALQKYF